MKNNDILPFNIPTKTGNELESIKKLFDKDKFCGDGYFTNKCTEYLNSILNCENTLLTTSCTHALEMCAILLDVSPGDEIIMPSFTFVSTANAFLLRGAKIIFADIEPNTMNISVDSIRSNISKKTKAVVVVHYAGRSCKMNEIIDICRENSIAIIEDAAQGIGGSFNNQALGTLGDLGCISFHETKNLHCGEGGALIINDKKLVDRAEIIREKGTNRKKFIEGIVDKYTWVDIGSSYLLSDINAAFLYEQLKQEEYITSLRSDNWKRYYQALKDIKGVEVPLELDENVEHNGHIFYIKTLNKSIRNELIQHLKKFNIQSTFHYIPLHSSPYGQIAGSMKDDIYTTRESDRLLRLPIFHEITKEQIEYVCEKVILFFEK